ncbi:MAG: PAS domain S-box protein [Gammaproteobacteria bacterium]|nr:PAS domain S-box protein [Gammaproteobacteria bacterium]
MHLKISQKISLLTSILIISTTLIIGGLFYYKTTNTLVKQAIVDITDEVLTQGLRLKTHIEIQREDTQFLSRLPQARKILNTYQTNNNTHEDNNEFKKQLQDIFITFQKSKPAYIQLRLIAADGMELVRVNAENGNPQVVKDKELQNKKDQSYVDSTLELSPGEIYLSEINLNREQGKVVVPHQPVLRSAIPVYTNNSARATGILIINAEIDHELDNIQNTIHDTGRDIYITNSTGSYIAHPDRLRTFGFDLGNIHTAQQDFPLTAALFKNNYKNKFMVLPPDKKTDRIAIFTKIPFDESRPERFISIGISQPYATITSQQQALMTTTIGWSILLLSIAVFITFIFSEQLIKPLVNIISAINKLSSGQNTLKTLPVAQKDEIGQLAHAFNNMTTQISNARENLETQIGERTTALTESKRMLQIVLDTIPVRVFWKDRKGTYLGCNKLFSKDAGLESPQQLTGKNDKDMPWTDIAEAYQKDDMEVINSGKSKLNFEEKQTTPDGSTIWLETSKTPLTDENNEIIGVLGTYQDISKRKQIEDTLNHNRDRLSSILDNMVDGLVTIDEMGLIESFNKAAEHIFGYGSDEVTGKNISMLMPQPYAQEHDGYLANFRTTGIKKIIGIGREVEGLRKDGTTFPLDLAISEVTLGDKRIFSGIIRDITDRKKMEKIKNEFISTVSHELRTPLTSIRGSLGLLNGGAVGELPEQAREMLKIASNNTERLLILINDILDIQKIESGNMAFDFKPLKLTEFLEQALIDNKAYGDQYGVSFKLTQTTEHIQVFADRSRLMQVMSNLLSNAAKFSSAGDTIEITSAIHKDSVRISVTDHGPGIPLEFQPRLFEKFSQSDSSDTRQKGGTGLGLSISKLIAEQHGGRIGFISQQGIGSCFYIDLPRIIDNITCVTNNLHRQLSATDNARILIIEDDQDIAALLQRMLLESGFDSDIAYSATDARHLLFDKKNYYQLITLDIMLPDEDGIQLLNSLRQQVETATTPVVVISVKADETRQRLKGGAIGVIDWLSKPIDELRLKQTILAATRSPDRPQILHIEDEEDVHKIVATMLDEECELSWAKSYTEASQLLNSGQFDLVLLDIGLPDGNGLDLIKLMEQHDKPPQIIIFSAQNVAKEYADRVNTVLIKSRHSNQQLLDIIHGIIH